MKILCSYSSLEFQCEHFPGHLTSRESFHPIFSIPQKKLLSYLGKWSSGTALTHTDNYLLFLAILKSSDLIEFRTAAVQSDITQSLIANHMERLAKTVLKLNTVTNPSVVFPRYVINLETRNLHNISAWIENWEDAYKDFLSGYKSAHDFIKITHKEAALERLIKNPHKPISSYSSQIADWAALAGQFPSFILISPFTGMKITCADYWKIIIQRCAKEESIFSVRRPDIIELLEHCEDHIPIGSIYSNTLFRILRHAIERQRNYLELGDADIGTGSGAGYKILDSSSSVEEANLLAMIQSAPTEEPKIQNYPSRIKYIIARSRWDVAQKYGDSSSSSSS